MNKRTGIFVFTATPEMAQAMPKVFKTGSTYVAQRADSLIDVSGSSTDRRMGASAKQVTKKAGKTQPKVTKPVKAPTKAGSKPAKVSGGRRSSPEAVVQFVRANEGCNMTQIEAATKMAQPDIRKALTDARVAGQIRTEGQRRGLRYFAVAAGAASSSDKTLVPDAVPVGSTDTPW